MPKPSQYVLIWLHEREHYELHMHGHLHQRFQRGDDEAFSRWLEEHTSFAFVGKSGRISVLKEARPGGTGYWYAYRTQAPPLSTILTTLLEEMEQVDREFILVLDDYHAISDPAIHESLRAHIRLALGAALRFVNSANLGNETLYASMAAQAERTFTRLEALLRSKRELAFSDAEVALIERRLLHALIETRAIIQRGDTERLQQLAPETEALPQDEEVGWNIIPVFLAFRLIAVLRGEGASLISRLLTAKQRVAEAGDFLATIRVMSWLALARAHRAAEPTGAAGIAPARRRTDVRRDCPGINRLPQYGQDPDQQYLSQTGREPPRRSHRDDFAAAPPLIRAAQSAGEVSWGIG